MPLDTHLRDGSEQMDQCAALPLRSNEDFSLLEELIGARREDAQERASATDDQVPHSGPGGAGWFPCESGAAL